MPEMRLILNVRRNAKSLWHNQAMQPPIIIDIEASGFGKSGYPIEIGFICDKAQTWCALIKPQLDWQYWDKNAEHIHHISREILEVHGKPAREIAQILNVKLRGKTVYSDGWAHDFVWMAQLFDSAQLVPTFKLEDLRKTLNIHQEAYWHEIKNQVITDLKAQRHRASIDAKVLQMTWLKTRELATVIS